ncbi:hypothetical protein ACQP3C_29840, partial [Escherichia coli]
LFLIHTSVTGTLRTSMHYSVTFKLYGFFVCFLEKHQKLSPFENHTCRLEDGLAGKGSRQI